MAATRPSNRCAWRRSGRRRHLPSGLHRARRYRDIIARFGRFPHRQPIFGRPLAPEEIGYLNAGGFQG
ncbi:DUF924 family protein [Paracoccus saliphilus]|uniref:DUF924 family protein n=1 Tax=Paracoccus saliphilus TaxID=405559 RepID=A0ABY7S6S7_9RHOB|nr:DUF924 family protein [Paracoccus saliphilus]